METECLWLLFGVCRTQILPLLDPGVWLLAIRIASKHHACTLFELEKKVEPASTALTTACQWHNGETRPMCTVH